MRVLIPGALQSYTRQPHVQAVGHTLDALLDELDLQYPGQRLRAVDEQKSPLPTRCTSGSRQCTNR